MPSIQHHVLKWLSAAVWYIGAGVLLWKGTARFFAAAADLDPVWPIGLAALSFALGTLQGRTVFRNACVRNLRRIRALERPRPWQFFRPRFFLALAAMIGGAAWLSVLAESGPVAMVVVAAVDWLIGFSLLVSSEVFWVGSANAPIGAHPAAAAVERGPTTDPGEDTKEPAA